MHSSEKKSFSLDPRSAAAALVFLAVFAGLHRFAKRFTPLPFPAPNQIQLSEDDAVPTIGFFSLGLRRLSADLAFVQLLMYYGTSEHREDAPHEHDEGHGQPGHVHKGGESGYPLLESLALRVLQRDPYFTYAALFSAGVLAFNLDRPDEALRVLTNAARFSPREWKYRAYVAAIGFHQKGDPSMVIEELTPLLDEPDCPTFLKNIVAFLNRRLGRNKEAIRIYLNILESRDTAYHDVAMRALKELGAR